MTTRPEIGTRVRVLSAPSTPSIVGMVATVIGWSRYYDDVVILDGREIGLITGRDIEISRIEPLLLPLLHQGYTHFL